MSQTPTMLFIFTFLSLSSLCFLPCFSVTLTLTHRDSPQSLLYNPDLSDFQRFTVSIDISKSRATRFEKQTRTMLYWTKKPKNESFVVPLTQHNPLFTVELSFGTPLVKRTFMFDTGSGLTWTQCTPCLHCFKQSEPLFDFKKSKSYKKLTRKEDKAKSFVCNRDRCEYEVEYGTGQKTFGVASTEKFYFHTKKGDYRKYIRLIFGCGIRNEGSFGQMPVSGIFGLDRERISFAHQLSSLTKGRFSYCFPELKSKRQSYLRFGADAFMNKTGSQSTPLIRTDHNDTSYRLILTDISINGQKLRLKRDTFPEGCVIDSGTSVSLLNREAYKAVVSSLDQYFSRFKGIGVQRLLRKNAQKDLLCYTRPRSFGKFPTMTLHFNGADYQVPAGSLFYFEENFFCMAIFSSERMTLLGVHQQQNVRVLYDLREEKLSFAQDDCSKDAVAA